MSPVSASHSLSPSRTLCRTKILEKLRVQPRSHYLMTTRFKNENHSEMLAYCAKRGLKCVYSGFTPISDKVPSNVIMFMLEMNNDQNKIVGIGMLRNNLSEKKHNIYSEEVYNAYTYLGSHRIDRNDMTKEEEDIMMALDVLCFQGKGHIKRCRGITFFPLDMLEKCKKKIDLTEFIRKMFITRIRK